MFMLVSNHQKEILKLQQEVVKHKLDHLVALKKLNILKDQWNALVDKINAKGGEDFLNSTPNTSGFTQAEIKSLIYLCHPDKHQQKPTAVELTQKLLSMRRN